MKTIDGDGPKGSSIRVSESVRVRLQAYLDNIRRERKRRGDQLPSVFLSGKAGLGDALEYLLDQKEKHLARCKRHRKAKPTEVVPDVVVG